MASMMRAEDVGGLAGDLAGRHELAGPDAARLSAFRARIEIRMETRVEGRADGDSADGDYAMPLSTLIETEIIPRLVVAHAGDSPRATDKPAVLPHSCPVFTPVTNEDVEAMVPLALNIEADLLLGHVEAILSRGVSVDTVLVDLLAPAARLLGEYWEDDRCDFVDVTMGLWRLQEVVHELATRVPADRPLEIGGHRALFASMPGDQHSFGTVVIDELFRREGWLTDRLSEVETPELLRRAADEWFDMIGLTISCDCHIAGLGAIIVALRNVSRNPRVAIMVGGRLFSADPDLAATVGADGTARDAKLALKLAETLVRARERETASCS